jgi:hypothetical protein
MKGSSCPTTSTKHNAVISLDENSNFAALGKVLLGSGGVETQLSYEEARQRSSSSSLCIGCEDDQQCTSLSSSLFNEQY